MTSFDHKYCLNLFIGRAENSDMKKLNTVFESLWKIFVTCLNSTSAP